MDSVTRCVVVIFSAFSINRRLDIVGGVLEPLGVGSDGVRGRVAESRLLATNVDSSSAMLQRQVGKNKG